MLSNQGIADLAADEGIVLKAYRCPAGVWTIGVGHTSAAGAPKVTPGMTITRDAAMEILKRDVARFEARVEAAMGASISQRVRDGATSFDFNTGAINRASWVTLWKAGAWRNAKASFLSWNKAGGQVLKGLVRRREREATLIFNGAAAPAPADSAQSTTPAEIASYQEALIKLGDYTGKPDGIAGPETSAAVKAFQRRRGLTPDGVVGPATRAELTRALGERTANRVTTGGSVAGGAGGAGTEVITNPPPVPDPAAADPTTVDPGVIGDAAAAAMIELVIWAVIVGGAIWLGCWGWRNRGRLFAWLPEGIKDAAARVGLTIGRRVPT